LRGSLNAKRGYLLLLFVVLAFYFYGLGHLPLVGPDEPRYAQVAREMFLRGDLITPTLAGHTWFEKPVLLYWLMEASYRLFGVSESSARLGPAFSGVLTVLAVYWLGKRVERVNDQIPDFALASALIIATMFGMIVFSRGASFDIVLTMTLTWSLCFFLAAVLEQNTGLRRGFLLGFYVFLGLSLLAKGLVGLVLPVGVVLLFYLLVRELPDRVVRLSLLWGLPVAIAVSAVWYAPVIARHGWVFVDEFFIQHHFARYFSDKYHHPQAFYFYLPILLALALPWLPLTVGSFVSLKDLRWRAIGERELTMLFVVAWIAGPLLFFSFSKSKLPGYILPVLPAVALLSGFQFTKLLFHRRVLTLRLTGLLFVLFAVGIMVYGSVAGGFSKTSLLVVAAPALIAGTVAILAFNVRLALASLVLAVPLGFGLALNLGAPAFAAKHSTRALFERAAERGYGSARVYQLHDIDRGAEFYASGRLVYDAQGEPMKFEGASEVVAEAIKRRETILVLVPLKFLGQLETLNHVRIEVVGDNTELALVALRAES
jgi:4-amino-4-deoxy-L-arabinose transferase-like glycosyltransferase